MFPSPREGSSIRTGNQAKSLEAARGVTCTPRAAPELPRRCKPPPALSHGGAAFTLMCLGFYPATKKCTFPPFVQGRQEEGCVSCPSMKLNWWICLTPVLTDDICLPPQQISAAKKSRSLLSTLPSLMCFKMVSAGLSDCLLIHRLWDLVNNSSESTLSTTFMIFVDLWCIISQIKTVWFVQFKAEAKKQFY